MDLVFCTWHNLLNSQKIQIECNKKPSMASDPQAGAAADEATVDTILWGQNGVEYTICQQHHSN